MNTTTTAGATSPVSLEAMTRVMKEIDLLPNSNEWTLIDPQGRVYKGSVEQVMPALMAEHPLFKMPHLRDALKNI